MNEAQLQAQIADLSVASASLTTKIEGFHKIYNAACIAGVPRDMDNMREQLHALLDLQLDQNASLFMLMRQLIAIKETGGL